MGCYTEFPAAIFVTSVACDDGNKLHLDNNDGYYWLTD